MGLMYLQVLGKIMAAGRSRLVQADAFGKMAALKLLFQCCGDIIKEALAL
jgi:hypothetical protein